MAFMAFNLGEWDGIIHSWLVFPASNVWLPVDNHPKLGGAFLSKYVSLFHVVTNLTCLTSKKEGRKWKIPLHQPQTKLSWSQAPFLAESHIRPWLWVILSTRHVMWQRGRRELQILELQLNCRAIATIIWITPGDRLTYQPRWRRMNPLQGGKYPQLVPHSWAHLELQSCCHHSLGCPR